MTRTFLSAIVAIAATAVVYAGQQGHTMVGAPASIRFQSANKNFQVLVPVSGTWTADYEKGDARTVQMVTVDGTGPKGYEKTDARIVQVLTIDGTAASKAPDAAAARALFGDKSAGFVTALAAPGAFPLAVARDVPTFPSGTLEVSFKLVSGATDQTAGIVFGLQPDGSYTYARYNTKDGNVAVWKFENGERTVLQHGDVHEQLPLNQWHTLQVTIAGAVVSAAVKGSTLAARHTLPAPVQGRVGVWTKTDSVTSFKDFVAAGHHLVHR
jgi:hypothetical protein